MKENNQRNGRSPSRNQEKEDRRERVKRAQERLRSGFYASPDVISFLADRIITAKG